MLFSILSVRQKFAASTKLLPFRALCVLSGMLPWEGIKIERLLVRHGNRKQSFRFLIDLSIDYPTLNAERQMLNPRKVD